MLRSFLFSFKGVTMKDYKPSIDWLQMHVEPSIEFNQLNIDVNEQISSQVIEQSRHIGANPHLDVNDLDSETQINLIFEELKPIFHIPVVLSDAGQKQMHYSKTLSIVDAETGEVLVNISARNKKFGCSVTIQGGLHPVALSVLDTPMYKRSSTYIQRVDVAFDFMESDEPYDKVYPVLADIAKNEQRNVSTAGDWLYKEKGRTLYLGSRGGFSFVRFYEKGKQLKNQDKGTYDGEDFNRLEFEFHPKKVTPSKAGFLDDFKKKLYMMFFTDDWSVENVLSYCTMATKITNEIIDMKIAPQQKTKRKYEDEYASVAHMLNQYSKIVNSLLETHSISLNELFSTVASAKLRDSSIQEINTLIIKELSGSRIGSDGKTLTERKNEETKSLIVEYDKGFVDSHIDRVLERMTNNINTEYHRPKSFKEMYGKPKYQ